MSLVEYFFRILRLIPVRKILRMIRNAWIWSNEAWKIHILVVQKVVFTCIVKIVVESFKYNLIRD